MTNGMHASQLRPDSAMPRNHRRNDENKAQNFKDTLTRLLKMLKPFTALLFVVFVVTIISTVFATISPKLLGGVTTRLSDFLLNHVALDQEAILKLMLLLVILYAVSFICDTLRVYLMVGMTQKIILRLRCEVDEKLNRLPLSFFDKNPAGDIMSRATNDIDMISQTLQSTLSEIVSAVVTLFGVIFMMLTISPLLTVICLLTLPAGAVLTGFIVKKSHRFFRMQTTALGELNGHIEEAYTAHTLLRAYGQEEKSQEEFDEINRRLSRAYLRAQFASGVSYPLNGIVTDLSYIAICLIGGLRAISGAMTLGDIQAFIQYSQRFANPIGTLSNVVNVIQSAMAGAERVFGLLDEKEEEVISQQVLPSVLKGNVDFENISFSYLPEKPLITRFTLHVKSGETVAIVGHTGAGKTTLVNLLMRFYDVSDGRILVDNVDIHKVTRQEIRSRIGMVLQDAWLFEGTIFENIAYGAPRGVLVTQEMVEKAAETAHLHYFIKTLPEGYQTRIAPGADNLSAGQKQLLTIARAVIADPSILILDEATSFVDTRTEQQIQSAMVDVMQGRTCFIIAHRLSTIRHAKTILVMDEGKVVEFGNHETLLAKGGVYAKLYQAQFLGNVS